MKRLICLFLTFLFLAGCGGGGEKEASKTAYTFTDDLGRTVTVEQTPRRVAALLGSFADIWVLAGGELCAAAEDAWEDFGLELPEVVNIGGAHSPSLELLLAAEPDFVIASASTASNVQMGETLEAAGITVAYFDVECFDDYLQMLELSGCDHLDLIHLIGQHLIEDYYLKRIADLQSVKIGKQLGAGQASVSRHDAVRAPSADGQT